MQWQLSPSVIAEAATALGLLVAAIFFPWRYLNRRARLTGSILLIVAALWILAHSLEIGTPVATIKAYLMGLQLILGLFALTLWLLYIIHYVAPEKWQARRISALFGIVPLVAILAMATNHLHGLLWTAPGLNVPNPYLPLEPDYGLVYWICMAYMGALVVFGSFLILNKVVRKNNYRTWEPWILILAVLLPIVAAFLEVTGFTQPAGLTFGITPFSSSIGAVALVWSLPRFHLQKIVPVARHTVFENISDGVVVLNMQNRVVDMNPAAERLAGYTASKALGMPVEQIWPSWPAKSVASEPASTVFEGLGLVCAGEQKYFTLHIYPVSDNRDRALNMVVLLIDTTERKQAEEERHRLREKAEIAGRLAATGEMAAGIAHEINNPLTGVLGFAQLLAQKQDVPAEIRKGLKIIADGSNRVKDIVKRMLTFSRKSEPMRTDTSINELIGATLDLRRYVLNTANIEVIRHLDPDLPRLFVNPGEMQQVFLNLIVNAEYAMKKAHGRGTLTITTEKKDESIRISFRDDGIGMNEEVKAKLFQPFFTTKAVGEGTGLGLGLSRSIVVEHGGTIEAESQLGRGSTFTVILPTARRADDATAQSEAVTSAPTKKLRSARILIVDDEEAIRLLVSTVLSQNDCAVDATGEAGKVFAKLESASYDIVLMDIRMPGMSGMELYAGVIEKHPELTGKFIFMTGDSSDLTTRAFLEQNKLTYLTKPFDIETLLEKVSGIL
jgi:PAS domain S-box-containing protein